MNHQRGSDARLRYTATGALAALAAAGAIAGTAALAAGPPAKAHAHAALRGAAKTPTSPGPDKTQTAPPAASDQPFLDAIQRLVGNGTITATEGQVVDSEIQTGSLDTQTLASSGLTPAPLQAVEQTLSNTKRALASEATGGPRAPKQPPSTAAADNRRTK